MPGTVTVRGYALRATPPDEADVSLLLTEVRSRSDDAHERVARRSERLLAICDELGIAPERRTTYGVSVAEEREWRKSREVHAGYRASTRLLVRLDDFEALGELIARATEEAQAELRGPAWRISPENPGRVEACRAAVEDARRRASAYAEGLGMRLGPVEAVVEAGLARPEPFAPAAPAAAQALAAPARAARIEVEPGEQQVSAAVEVTWLLEPGGG